MIVCHCAVVSDRDIRDQVAAGARTVSQVLRETGAASGCGGCDLAVRACARAALCQAASDPTHHSELEVLHATG